MKLLFIKILLLISTIGFQVNAFAHYERNKAVQVEQVLFGYVTSVRNITQQELIADKNHGWKVFGGALVGGAIGNQFGSGSGRDIATVLGALLGGQMANNRNPSQSVQTIELVELMIKTDTGDEYMVIQDLDSRMIFQRSDPVRMVYLAGGMVRIDKQM